MPVLVTGATGFIGRALVPRLVAEGGQVRAYVRRDAPDLRALGCKVAVGEADDEGRLESALEQVHTLVHLVGSLLPERGVTYDWLNRETTEVAVRAARNAGVRRVVCLSFPGADPSSPNDYLAAKGRAEQAVRESGLEHVIFRCSPVVGPGDLLARYLGRFRRAPLVPVPGSGRQRLNPVAVGDVGEALARADARGTELRDTWDLGGPDVVTFDELVDLAIGRKRKVHLRRPPGLSAVLAEVYGGDAMADPARAVARFGLALMPLREALRAAAP